MAHSDRDRYSTLEVWNTDPQDKIPVPRNGATTPLTPDVQNSQDHTQGATANAFGQRRRKCGLSPKMFWAAVVILTLVILGAIAGGVAGGLANRGSGSDLEDRTSPDGQSPNLFQMSAVYLQHGTIKNYEAVFYLKNGSIHISWKLRRSEPWTEQNVESGFFLPSGEPGTLNAAPNTPLAAVVFPSGQSGILRLFYIDTEGVVRDIQCNVTESKWVQGHLWEGERVTSAPSSALAAMAHYCSSPLCSNQTLVVYQLIGGCISSVWAMPDRPPRIECITKANIASPLALALGPSGINGTERKVARLYYQSKEKVSELIFNEEVRGRWVLGENAPAPQQQRFANRQTDSCAGKESVMDDLPAEKLHGITASIPVGDSRGLVLATGPSTGKVMASWISSGGWNGTQDTPSQNLPVTFRNNDATVNTERPEDITGIALEGGGYLLYTRSRKDSKIRRYQWTSINPSQFILDEVLGD